MSGFRHRVLRWLPRPLRRILRRWNSLRQVASFTEDRWPEAAWVRPLVKPGGVVVDAGANIGYITALLARWVGAAGRVHSIEPVPETSALLRVAVQRMGLHQVRVHACAVSSSEGMAEMEVPAYPEGGENFYESRVVPTGGAVAGGQRVSVRLATLDQLLGEDVARVCFAKVDVEGHEESALQGAGRLLREAHPAWLIEVNGGIEEGAGARVRALLESHGYAAYVSGASGLRRWVPSLKAVDYYFLTSAQAAASFSALEEKVR